MPSGIYVRTEKVKEILRLCHFGQKAWNKGKTGLYSPKTLKAISNALKGRILTEAHKEKLSEAKSGLCGDKSNHWNGGRVKTKRGYILVLSPGHQFKNKAGYVFEHRLVMEKRLGRYLTLEEVVHHENEIKDDNNDKNLMLFANNTNHKRYHSIKNNGGLKK